MESSHRVRAGLARAPRTSSLVPALSFLLALTGGIHLAAIPEHLDVSALDAAFFVVVAAAQLGLAVVVARRPGRSAYGAAVLLALAVTAVWIVSRTVGVPFGGHAFESEPARAADLTAAALQVAGAAIGVHLLRSERIRTRRAPSGGSLALAALAAMTFTVVVQPAGAHGHGKPAGHGHVDGVVHAHATGSAAVPPVDVPHFTGH